MPGVPVLASVKDGVTAVVIPILNAVDVPLQSMTRTE